MARLSKDNWLAEGEKILSEFAQNKLRILYLCERLGVTRGSFYHHFDSIESYVTALMEKWATENTLAFIESADSGVSPEEQMEILNRLVVEADQSVEAAIRSWSHYHPIVKAHLEEVDAIRLDYLHKIFSQLIPDSDRARAVAELEYALLVGVQQLYSKAPKEKVQQLYQVYKEMNWSKP